MIAIKNCRSVFILPAALSLILALTACEETTATRATVGYNQSFFYRPNFGRVGYHMSAVPLVYEYDPSFQCGTRDKEYVDHFEVTRGTLPPGLTFDQVSGEIAGTPRQPGQWDFEVTVFGIGCTDIHFGPADIPHKINFQIQP